MAQKSKNKISVASAVGGRTPLWDHVLAYGIAIMSVGLTASLGSTFTYSSVRSSWYECIQPKDITPPRAVFPVVWSILYVLIAIAMGRAIALKHHTIVALFAMNLCLNAAWSWAYFTQRDVILAFAIIAVLMLTIVAIILTCPDPIVKYTMIPYAIWVAFATLLNAMSIKNVRECQKTQN